MKVGDLVRQKVDKCVTRTGVIVESVMHDGDEICKVIWSTQPYGRSKLSAAWGRDLEVISEAR